MILQLAVPVLLLLARRAAGGEVNSLRCATVSTPAWTRRLCFEAEHAVSLHGDERYSNVTLAFTLHADEAKTQPVCGDTLRVQFVSSRALVPASPGGQPVAEPGACAGRFTAHLQVPHTGRRTYYTPEIQARRRCCSGGGCLSAER